MIGPGRDRRSFLRLAVGGFLGSMTGTVFVSHSREVRATTALGIRDKDVVRVFRAMGTLLEIRLQGMAERDAVHAIGLVRRRVAELEAAMTIFRPESPLPELSAARVGTWIGAPSDLITALCRAGDSVRRTGGAFDPTVAPMVRAWGLHDQKLRFPDPVHWRDWCDRPGWDALEIDVPGSRVRRLDRRVEVDLGGIGKGIAMEEVVSLLRDQGARSGLINFGGSLGVLGTPIDVAQGWPVGIVHPRRSEGVWSELFLRSGFLATSADSERYHFGPEGRRYHHILDPRDGRPVPRIASATVWAESAVDADVDSTAVFVNAGRCQWESTESPAVDEGRTPGPAAPGRFRSPLGDTAGGKRPTLLLSEGAGEGLSESQQEWFQILG